MKFVHALSLLIAPLGAGAISAALAQSGDGFSTQRNTAGWETAEDPQAEQRREETAPATPPVASGPVMRGNQAFGWQFSVNAPQGDTDAELTELERLSISASGLKYGSGLYDAKSDNPLIPVSVTLRALDKITAKYTDLTIEIDETSRFGELAITPRTCDKRPPEEFPETTAFLEIDDLDDTRTQVLDADYEGQLGREDDPAEAVLIDAALTESVTVEPDLNTAEVTDHLFSGWMFASSPSLNALEHPVYDVWVIDCKMVEPPTL
ncbi:DUF2155 domain-containing protein [Parvularcula sp. IMCC14364]|uniref:DUF2155 domain-containing protein n=1 Tax=Parvularcula sp. IMCC14364 TaxID=3067902 RepID=UPI002740ED17|nr:DUF2155 domain-containing protein [Parvularcula sp. IMCC14364]